jgi:hypothetical protein
MTSFTAGWFFVSRSIENNLDFGSNPVYTAPSPSGKNIILGRVGQFACEVHPYLNQGRLSSGREDIGGWLRIPKDCPVISILTINKNQAGLAHFLKVLDEVKAAAPRQSPCPQL